MNDIQFHPMLARQDVVRAAAQLLQPAVKCLAPGKARMIGPVGMCHVRNLCRYGRLKPENIPEEVLNIAKVL